VKILETQNKSALKGLLSLAMIVLFEYFAANEFQCVINNSVLVKDVLCLIAFQLFMCHFYV